VISHLFSDKIPEKGKNIVIEIINSEFIISVVVEIEILTYNENEDKLPLIASFIELATILPLDLIVTKKTIELRRKYRKLKLGDAIIAATAISNDLILITNNEKDFLNIKNLKVMNPHKL
jgi:predicted nucleic acid-binding protein